MKNTTFCLITLLSLSCSSLLAQKSPWNWGAFPPEQLEMESYAPDPDAGALVLGNYGRWEVKSSGKGLGYKAILHRHVRVKILSESGLEWADGNFQYVHAEKFERVYDFEGQTLNWENGSLQISPIEKENIFSNKIDESISELQFTFPRVKVGSIIEYRYKRSTLNIYSLYNWDFQLDDPVLHAEISIKSPKLISYHAFPQYARPEEKGPDHWVMRNVPALKEEPYVDNMENYRAKMQFRLNDYQKTRYSGNYRVISKGSFFNDWEELMAELWSINSSEVFSAKGANELKNKVTALTDSLRDESGKARALFNFVRDSIEWNGAYNLGTRGRSSLTTFQERKGDGADLNSLLSLMLNTANIPSEMLAIGTRDHGRVKPDQVFMGQFNHLICVAVVDSQMIFMDATSPFCPYDLLPARNLNHIGVLVRLGEPDWLNIPENYESYHMAFCQVEIDEEGNLTGNIREIFQGYAARDLREAIHLAKDEKTDSELLDDFWYARMGAENPDTELDSIEIQHAENPDKSLTLNYSFSSGDFSNQIGEYLYINPMLCFGERENAFLEPERQHEIDFNYLLSRELVGNITIPKGYEVESLPKGVRVVFEDRTVVFEFGVQQLGPLLQLRSTFKTGASRFPPESYTQLKKVFDELITKHGEQIVLKRTETAKP